MKLFVIGFFGVFFGSQTVWQTAWADVVPIKKWSVGGDPILENKNLSGIACVSDLQCVLASDETVSIQRMEKKDSGILEACENIELLLSSKEMDAEGVAVSGNHYFITGNHGRSKKGKLRPSQFNVFKLEVDPQTGRPVGENNSHGIPNILKRASLRKLLRTDPVLGAFAEKRLQQNGLNIEGLAAKGERLYFGFRGPNLDGKAFVLSIDEKDLFDSEEKAYRVQSFELGTAVGIREIVSVEKGFLIISGDVGYKYDRDLNVHPVGNPFRLHFWDGESDQSELLGEIPDPPGKAEGMIVLEETKEGYRVLILFGGPPNGEPTEYRISKS